MADSSWSPARDNWILRAWFHRVEADGDAPVLLPLHGYPRWSHLFEERIPPMATRYRVIARDLPDFGSTTVAGECNYKYSFGS
jgi:pimeloyl-ACP methyl ester carboxylesterase